MSENKNSRLARAVADPCCELDTPLEPSIGERLLNAEPRLETVFTKERRAAIRVLIVADGGISFGAGKFGLTEMIHKALRPSPMPWEELTIVTAHRSREEDTANIPNFRFNVKPEKPPYDHEFSIEHYDQVWLFGQQGEKDKDGKPFEEALSDEEVLVLMDFMNAGGGVFATGDHQDLGAALCGKVPRVRSMRKWFFFDVSSPEQQAPDRNGPTRLDTLREGGEVGFQVVDQSDITPQEIRPKLRKLDYNDISEPHALLGYERSAVTFLPDHMHEGECVVPDASALAATIKLSDGRIIDEYPRAPEQTDRVAPEVVAVSTSAGGYLIDIEKLFPVNPRCFNVIVAYDGHEVNMVVNEKHVRAGRVVVDTTFHHFVNINLCGATTKKNGLYDANCNPTEEYKRIKQYYRNIKTWLCPPPVKFKYYARMLLAVRYMHPLDEEIRSATPWTLDELLFAGGVTRKAITDWISLVEATQCALAVADMLPQDEIAITLKSFIHPWLPFTLRREPSAVLLNARVTSNAILGGAMLGLAKALPENPSLLDEALAELENSGKSIETLVIDGASHALGVLLQALEESGSLVEKFSVTLSKNLDPVFLKR